MSKPYLIIIAGCNGSGKSTFSRASVKGIIPFDYDKKFIENYNTLQDIDIRSEMAREKTTQEFESSIDGAFSNKESFCYETNFDTSPLFWAQQAKSLGYHVELHFYCIQDQQMARDRVALRTRNAGHPVPDDVVDYKWREGYKNLNLHFDYFDRVVLFENSSSNKPMKALFTIEKQIDSNFEVEMHSYNIPNYARRRFPRIYELLKSSSWKFKLRSIF